MTLFVVASAVIVYVLFGYPLLIAIWSRMVSGTVVKKFTPRSVSVLLPVHNGDRWLAEKLRVIQNLNYPQGLIQTIVISNASTDGTLAIAQEHAGPSITVIDVPEPGKARALNAGLALAQGEIVFFTDVRQDLHPDSLRILVSNFADERVGAVSGELIIREGDSLEESSVGLYWKMEKMVRAMQSRIGSVPGATGAIYAMRRELTRPIPAGTVLDDVYLPLCAYFQGYRVVWEAGAKAFDFPASLQTEFRRKVRTLAGVYQIVGLFPRLLIPNHGLWIHFVSHKLGRLMLPYALLVVLLSSFALTKPLNYLSLAAQAAFYGLAAIDTVLSNHSPLKRFSSLASTFVVLMVSAACASSIAFVPAEKLWKPTR